MKTIQELLVECWYDHIDLEMVKEWVYSYIMNNDVLPEELFELLDADKYNLENSLLKLATSLSQNFSHQSIEAELLSAQLLIKVASRYLDGRATPMDVCRVIRKIDEGFLDAPRGLPDNVAYYPNWLGNLYNSCDWCDDTWTYANAPHLKKNLETQAVAISEWIDSHNNLLNSDVDKRAN